MFVLCMQLEDDMFVMPTIPDILEAGSTQGMAGERRKRGVKGTRQPLPLAAPNNNTVMELHTGFELQDTMLL